jgi:hypothetical protein
MNFGEFFFWAPWIFWLSVPCLIYSWQRFYTFCGWLLQFKDHLFCFVGDFYFCVVPFVNDFS